MSLVRCDDCNGRKRTLGLGGMEKPCTACKGIGWVESGVQEAVAIKLDDLKTATGLPVKAKRKGRKPGLKRIDELHV